MEAQNSAIQKFLRSEISFYITIIVTAAFYALSFSAMYYGLTNQINLMSQKVESHISATEFIPELVYDLKERVAVLSEKTIK